MDDLSAAACRRLPANELKEREPGNPRAARDVAPGERWTFLDHRTMAEVIAAERDR